MLQPAIPLLKNALVISGSRSRGGSNWEQEILYGILGKSYRATEQYEEAIKAYQQIAGSSHRNKRQKKQ